MRREGFALIVALFVLAAVELLTLSTLALATHESIAANAQERTTAAVRTAQAALRRVMRDWPIAAPDTMAPGQSTPIPSAPGVTLNAQRHGWGLYEVTAAVPAGRAWIREAVLLRTLDFGRGIEESNDALVSAGPIIATAATFTATDTLTCVLPQLPSRAAADITVSTTRDAAGLPSALVDSLHAVPPAGYAFAGVQWRELASIADTIVHGSTSLNATDSLGAPIVRLTYAPGDVTITGGKGVGLLLVEGDLAMQAGTEFEGIVVVGGSVHLADGVRINGNLRIQGRGVSTIGAAGISYSRCACARALLRVPANRRLIGAQRRFIPAF